MQALVGPIPPRKQYVSKYQSRSLVPTKPMKVHQGVRDVGVESWPAHASSPDNLGTSFMLTKDKHMVVLHNPAALTTSKTSKPKFLDYLETFLRDELKYLGVTEVKPSELRLQAFRQVFEHLIEDFKTYRPLLSTIKNEYEMMLSAQREEIRRLEPLRQMLVTVAEESDQRIMELREEEKQDMLELKRENEALQRKIESMRNDQVSLEVQVEKLREELAIEYMRYRKAREDEMKASQRLLYIEAHYGDVIPDKNMKHSRSSSCVLLDLHKQTLAQRDEYYAESETLRRSSTPRPKWDRCADVVAGGTVRWTTLSASKTSDQLVEVLLNEITGSGGSDAAGAEYFDGMGMEEGVPKYLQYEGKVRNRRLGKRDCLLLIKDIWREKAAHDAEQEEGTKRVKLADFLHTYLERRFSLPQMVAEWAYNLNDACMRYSHDEAINMFASILNDEMDEVIYHNQLDGVTKLLGHLTKLDVENGNPGTLNKLEFQEALGQYFPDKSQEDVIVLLGAAEKELEAKDIDDLEYKNLFMEDDEGKTGPFLMELKKQWKLERHAYIDDIKAEMEGVTKVSVEDLKKAITTTDPEIDHDDMNKYLFWAFKVDTQEALEEVEPCDLAPLIVRLKNGDLKRIGKKPSP
ncbi:hypothetical protein NP493_106g07058 [Ridgeia piscesae]|uniref:Translin-associated factor X-interacting protein 1 N-terminal domain-containing protein n=1 Tax=Ridgeia piscesae TaxID=27915 RepID=A0AAD9UH94_RIDPI|nr:hypothetical protein NP493_106g07058 [Ridgeia piscesae]